MRIYRDVELLESLGSGIPRILRAYGEDCFKFTDNFIRITLLISVHDTAHDVGRVSKTIRTMLLALKEKLIEILSNP